MPLRRFLPASLVLALALAGHQANASTTTLAGTFSSDDQVFEYDFTASTAAIYNFYTTSYGGGTNADGTTTMAGGFVPVLTLFHGDGTVIGPSTAGGTMDPTTGFVNDAFLNETLGPGSYILALTQFPNGAIGNFSDGFLFGGQGNFTPGLCDGGDGSFLESDIAPCSQRTGDYSLNISTSPTPEPATWILMLPAAGLFAVFGRRLLA